MLDRERSGPMQRGRSPDASTLGAVVIEWDEAEYVKALYRAVLQRTPSSRDLDHHRHKLDHASSKTQAAGALLESFLVGDEARLRWKSMSLAGDIKKGDVVAREPAFFVSCGCHCYTGSMMKRFSLKTFSAPFDWIFSSPAMISYCFDDDFKTFLDQSHFSTIPEAQRSSPGVNFADHEYFKQNFKINRMFNHYDPSSEAGFQYMQRCVARLRSAMRAPSHTIFVCVAHDGRWPMAEFEAMAESIRRVAPRGILNVVLVSAPEEGRLLPQAEDIVSTDVLSIKRLKPLSTLGPTDFPNVLDEVALVELLRPSIRTVESINLPPE